MSILSTKDNFNFFITSKKGFSPSLVKMEHITDVLQFSFDMTFGEKGEHRNYRSGGSHFRKKGEIFCDTFQGKLAEFFAYQNFNEMNLDCPKPDLEKWELGKWDDEDFVINKKLINIKSMAFFSNLLLLETKDWESDGKYIPNNKAYDYFVVVRLKPDLKSVFRSHRLLYSNNINFTKIKEIVDKFKFEADIPGFVTNSKLVKIIESEQILRKGAMLNGRIKMDAENYYIMSSDFEDFKKIKKYIE